MNDKDKEALDAFIQQENKAVESEVVLYHADAKSIYISTDKNDNSSNICAKSVKYINSNTTRYYIKRLGCSFFDPTHISPIYKKQLWKMGPVSEEAFRLYLEFLGFGNPNAKGKNYLKTRAERLV